MGLGQTSSTWVDFLGHRLAGFQVSRWQTSGPARGPNIMSTFMAVEAQWEGFGRQPRYWLTRLTEAHLPSKTVFFV